MKAKVDMITKVNTEVRISTEEEISSAVRDFTNALVDSAAYKNYESASEKFQNDSEAQKALQEYRARAKDLQTRQMFNTVTEAEQQDIQRLWAAFLRFKSVQDFFDAQGEFQALSRACAQVISDACGLDYATSCSAGCCG
jgi:cell fate (sporulation/competence/biofilm development) regulator YlbF (YheA/YmcA/DUF963 family)